MEGEDLLGGGGGDVIGIGIGDDGDVSTEVMEKGSLSPLTGSYLLIILAEPHSEEDREIILQRLNKGLLSWDVDSSHVDLNCELLNLANSCPEGDEARNGEKLVQWASENLVVEVLIHSQVNTLQQCMKNLLASFTRHRHIIHAGYTFQGSGSWALQDGTFSLSDYLELWAEPEVQRILSAYKGDISVSMHCASEGLWTQERFSKEPFAKMCQTSVNPPDRMSRVHNSGISSFIEYISKMLTPSPLKEILEPSEIVGNIRFSHPTLYVFPGGQGDAALFGINGFNMLIDGGYPRRSCFWDFTRHLDRLDAVLLTRVNNNSVGGLSSVIQRKVMNQVYPQIGHFFGNVLERKGSSSGGNNNTSSALTGEKDKEKEASSSSSHAEDGEQRLLVSLTDEGQKMLDSLRNLNLKPHLCFRETHIEPINLYHKVGHGKLDLYILNPARDSREVKEFLSRWNSDCKSFVSSRISSRHDGKDFQYPVLNLVSICALLVWQPANPRDPITRILFPGSTPQHKIFEVLQKLKHLEFLKYPVCSAKTIAASNKSKVKSEKVISEAKQQLSKVSTDGSLSRVSGRDSSNTAADRGEKTITSSHATANAAGIPPSGLSKTSSSSSTAATIHHQKSTISNNKTASSTTTAASATTATAAGEGVTTADSTSTISSTSHTNTSSRPRDSKKKTVASRVNSNLDSNKSQSGSSPLQKRQIRSSSTTRGGKTTTTTTSSTTTSATTTTKVPSSSSSSSKGPSSRKVSEPPSAALNKKSSPTSPTKRSIGGISQEKIHKTTSSTSTTSKSSKRPPTTDISSPIPPSTPLKSAKDATNRRVIEYKSRAANANAAASATSTKTEIKKRSSSVAAAPGKHSSTSSSSIPKTSSTTTSGSKSPKKIVPRSRISASSNNKQKEKELAATAGIAAGVVAAVAVAAEIVKEKAAHENENEITEISKKDSIPSADLDLEAEAEAGGENKIRAETNGSILTEEAKQHRKSSQIETKAEAEEAQQEKEEESEKEKEGEAEADLEVEGVKEKESEQEPEPEEEQPSSLPPNFLATESGSELSSLDHMSVNENVETENEPEPETEGEATPSISTKEPSTLQATEAEETEGVLESELEQEQDEEEEEYLIVEKDESSTVETEKQTEGEGETETEAEIGIESEPSSLTTVTTTTTTTTAAAAIPPAADQIGGEAEAEVEDEDKDKDEKDDEDVEMENVQDKVINEPTEAQAEDLADITDEKAVHEEKEKDEDKDRASPLPQAESTADEDADKIASAKVEQDNQNENEKEGEPSIELGSKAEDQDEDEDAKVALSAVAVEEEEVTAAVSANLESLTSLSTENEPTTTLPARKESQPKVVEETQAQVETLADEGDKAPIEIETETEKVEQLDAGEQSKSEPEIQSQDDESRVLSSSDAKVDDAGDESKNENENLQDKVPESMESGNDVEITPSTTTSATTTQLDNEKDSNALQDILSTSSPAQEEKGEEEATEGEAASSVKNVQDSANILELKEVVDLELGLPPEVEVGRCRPEQEQENVEEHAGGIQDEPILEKQSAARLSLSHEPEVESEPQEKEEEKGAQEETETEKPTFEKLNVSSSSSPATGQEEEKPAAAEENGEEELQGNNLKLQQEQTPEPKAEEEKAATDAVDEQQDKVPLAGENEKEQEEGKETEPETGSGVESKTQDQEEEEEVVVESSAGTGETPLKTSDKVDLEISSSHFATPPGLASEKEVEKKEDTEKVDETRQLAESKTEKEKEEKESTLPGEELETGEKSPDDTHKVSSIEQQLEQPSLSSTQTLPDEKQDDQKEQTKDETEEELTKTDQQTSLVQQQGQQQQVDSPAHQFEEAEKIPADESFHARENENDKERRDSTKTEALATSIKQSDISPLCPDSGSGAGAGESESSPLNIQQEGQEQESDETAATPAAVVATQRKDSAELIRAIEEASTELEPEPEQPEDDRKSKTETETTAVIPPASQTESQVTGSEKVVDDNDARAHDDDDAAAAIKLADSTSTSTSKPETETEIETEKKVEETTKESHVKQVGGEKLEQLEVIPSTAREVDEQDENKMSTSHEQHEPGQQTKDTAAAESAEDAIQSETTLDENDVQFNVIEPQKPGSAPILTQDEDDEKEKADEGKPCLEDEQKLKDLISSTVQPESEQPQKEDIKDKYPGEIQQEQQQQQQKQPQEEEEDDEEIVEGKEEREPLEKEIRRDSKETPIIRTSTSAAEELAELDDKLEDKFIRPLPFEETLDSEGAIEKILQMKEKKTVAPILEAEAEVEPEPTPTGPAGPGQLVSSTGVPGQAQISAHTHTAPSPGGVPSAIPSKLPRESREVIRTPDEVADLPVHEEVEPGTYETDEVMPDNEEDEGLEEYSEEDPGVEAIEISNLPLTPTAPAGSVSPQAPVAETKVDTKEEEKEPVEPVESKDQKDEEKEGKIQEIFPVAPESLVTSAPDQITISPEFIHQEILASSSEVNGGGVVNKIDAAVSPVLESLLGQSPTKSFPPAEADQGETEVQKVEEQIVSEEPQQLEQTTIDSESNKTIIETSSSSQLESKEPDQTAVEEKSPTETKTDSDNKAPHPGAIQEEDEGEEQVQESEPEPRLQLKETADVSLEMNKMPSPVQPMTSVVITPSTPPVHIETSSEFPFEKEKEGQQQQPESAPQTQTESEKQPEVEVKTPVTAPADDLVEESVSKDATLLTTSERKLSVSDDGDSTTSSSATPLTAVSKDKDSKDPSKTDKIDEELKAQQEETAEVQEKAEAQNEAEQQSTSVVEKESTNEEDKEPGEKREKLFTLPGDDDEEESKSEVDDDDIYETDEPAMGAIRSGLLTAAATLSAAVLSQSPEDIAIIPSPSQAIYNIGGAAGIGLGLGLGIGLPSPTLVQPPFASAGVDLESAGAQDDEESKLLPESDNDNNLAAAGIDTEVVGEKLEELTSPGIKQDEDEQQQQQQTGERKASATFASVPGEERRESQSESQKQGDKADDDKSPTKPTKDEKDDESSVIGKHGSSAFGSGVKEEPEKEEEQVSEQTKEIIPSQSEKETSVVELANKLLSLEPQSPEPEPKLESHEIFQQQNVDITTKTTITTTNTKAEEDAESAAISSARDQDEIEIEADVAVAASASADNKSEKIGGEERKKTEKEESEIESDKVTVKSSTSRSSSIAPETTTTKEEEVLVPDSQSRDKDENEGKNLDSSSSVIAEPKLAQSLPNTQEKESGEKTGDIDGPSQLVDQLVQDKDNEEDDDDVEEENTESSLVEGAEVAKAEQVVTAVLEAADRKVEEKVKVAEEIVQEVEEKLQQTTTTTVASEIDSSVETVEPSLFLLSLEQERRKSSSTSTTAATSPQLTSEQTPEQSEKTTTTTTTSAVIDHNQSQEDKIDTGKLSPTIESEQRVGETSTSTSAGESGEKDLLKSDDSPPSSSTLKGEQNEKSLEKEQEVEEAEKVSKAQVSSQEEVEESGAGDDFTQNAKVEDEVEEESKVKVDPSKIEKPDSATTETGGEKTTDFVELEASLVDKLKENQGEIRDERTIEAGDESKAAAELKEEVKEGIGETDSPSLVEEKAERESSEKSICSSQNQKETEKKETEQEEAVPDKSKEKAEEEEKKGEEKQVSNESVVNMGQSLIQENKSIVDSLPVSSSVTLPDTTQVDVDVEVEEQRRKSSVSSQLSSSTIDVHADVHQAPDKPEETEDAESHKEISQSLVTHAAASDKKGEGKDEAGISNSTTQQPPPLENEDKTSVTTTTTTSTTASLLSTAEQEQNSISFISPAEAGVEAAAASSSSSTLPVHVDSDDERLCKTSTGIQNEIRLSESSKELESKSGAEIEIETATTTFESDEQKKLETAIKSTVDDDDDNSQSCKSTPTSAPVQVGGEEEDKKIGVEKEQQQEFRRSSQSAALSIVEAEKEGVDAGLVNNIIPVEKLLDSEPKSQSQAKTLDSDLAGKSTGEAGEETKEAKESDAECGARRVSASIVTEMKEAEGEKGKDALLQQHEDNLESSESRKSSLSLGKESVVSGSTVRESDDDQDHDHDNDNVKESAHENDGNYDRHDIKLDSKSSSGLPEASDESLKFTSISSSISSVPEGQKEEEEEKAELSLSKSEAELQQVASSSSSSSTTVESASPVVGQDLSKVEVEETRRSSKSGQFTTLDSAFSSATTSTSTFTSSASSSFASSTQKEGEEKQEDSAQQQEQQQQLLTSNLASQEDKSSNIEGISSHESETTADSSTSHSQSHSQSQSHEQRKSSQAGSETEIEIDIRKNIETNSGFTAQTKIEQAVKEETVGAEDQSVFTTITSSSTHLLQKEQVIGATSSSSSTSSSVITSSISAALSSSPITIPPTGKSSTSTITRRFSSQEVGGENIKSDLLSGKRRASEITEIEHSEENYAPSSLKSAASESSSTSSILTGEKHLGESSSPAHHQKDEIPRTSPGGSFYGGYGYVFGSAADDEEEVEQEESVCGEDSQSQSLSTRDSIQSVVLTSDLPASTTSVDSVITSTSSGPLSFSLDSSSSTLVTTSTTSSRDVKPGQEVTMDRLTMSMTSSTGPGHIMAMSYDLMDEGSYSSGDFSDSQLSTVAGMGGREMEETETYEESGDVDGDDEDVHNYGYEEITSGTRNIISGQLQLDNTGNQIQTTTNTLTSTTSSSSLASTLTSTSMSTSAAIHVVQSQDFENGNFPISTTTTTSGGSLTDNVSAATSTISHGPTTTSTTTTTSSNLNTNANTDGNRNGNSNGNSNGSNTILTTKFETSSNGNNKVEGSKSLEKSFIATTIEEKSIGSTSSTITSSSISGASSSSSSSIISTAVPSSSTTSSSSSTTITSSNITSLGTSETKSAADEEEDIVKTWGKPLGLPMVVDDQPTNTNNSGNNGGNNEGNNGGDANTSASASGGAAAAASSSSAAADSSNLGNIRGGRGGTPKKDRSVDRKNLPGTPGKSTSAQQRESRGRSHHRSTKNTNPIYVDLAYVPHHGNSNYCDSEFFRLIRSRYYVFSGLEPSRQVFDGLLQGKQAWEDKNLEVTIIPTYDTDTLGYWISDVEDSLSQAKIDLAPSASRCTINLQDHETSCSAYRLEF